MPGRGRQQGQGNGNRRREGGGKNLNNQNFGSNSDQQTDVLSQWVGGVGRRRANPWGAPGLGQTPTAPGVTPAPTEDAPTTEAPAPAGGELETLMAKERLTPEEIARARTLIAALPVEQRTPQYQALQAKTEYANQRDNESASESSTGGTCNLTSLAMCLEYMGISNPDPNKQYEDALDDIRIANKFGDITSASTWGKIASHLGVTMELLPGKKLSRAQWETEIAGDVLGAGKSMLVSIWGHIVRVQGVNDYGVVVDDPYGASKLMPDDIATDAYDWNATNGVGESDTKVDNAGEDLGWPWADVEKFTFKYFCVFG